MMKAVFITILFAFVANAEWFEESYARFKTNDGNFQTRYHNQFAGWSKEEIKALMGTKMGINPKMKEAALQYIEPEIESSDIPASFDSGTKWPKCNSTFSYIKDQAKCGSCWAVAASSTIAARICIAENGPDPNVQTPSNGKYLNEPVPPISFSAQQIMSCCSWCGKGCNGGYPIDALAYSNYFGVVTGGWYNSQCGCYPYEIDPTAENPAKTPSCQRSDCPNSNFDGSYSGDRHKAYTHYSIAPILKYDRVEKIQKEIMTNGPVECAFVVFENFMHYSGGVYDKKVGDALGGHAVTAYGWGTLNGVPYWTFHNSWNSTWGMNGKFLILRGSDFCAIESECVALKFKAGSSSWGLKC